MKSIELPVMIYSNGGILSYILKFYYFVSNNPNDESSTFEQWAINTFNNALLISEAESVEFDLSKFKLHYTLDETSIEYIEQTINQIVSSCFTHTCNHIYFELK